MHMTSQMNGMTLEKLLKKRSRNWAIYVALFASLGFWLVVIVYPLL